ncbi:Mitochondrial ATP synthase subunit G protein [Striga hermonthica]|uniref:Mitochondrial ATP synthase subunit G protein n=1 Tax=Striga hermonthica TaxID=68872 RepID=A0A9N7RQ29_STRHE|nr:Mitochondrial ATP synthase subunit G protein [Striga hermonthica]
MIGGVIQVAIDRGQGEGRQIEKQTLVGDRTAKPSPVHLRRTFIPRLQKKNLLQWFMAARLQKLQGKACQATKYVAEHGTAFYKQLMEQNIQYVKKPPTVETCNELSKQLLYTRLASIPGRTESFWKEIDYVKNMWKNRHELKVEDAGIAALFGLECFAWFCAGEIVGRGFTFTGYYP